jgi:hypothetical protein
MQFADILNSTDRVLVDISCEEVRTYRFISGGTVVVMNIVRPLALSVSKSGHYIIADDNTTTFVPFGFISVTWEPKSGMPNLGA